PSLAPMTDEELDRLADLIAQALLRTPASGPPAPARSAWLPAPVRPEPPARAGEPPVWAGAAQSLNDIAPSRGETTPAARRATTAELTNAARAAAAGRGAPLGSTGPRGRTAHASRPRDPGAPPIDVK